MTYVFAFFIHYLQFLVSFP